MIVLKCMYERGLNMKIFYVSSYGKNNDKGIYIMKFDETTLEMKRVQQIVTQDYPSYMITKKSYPLCCLQKC